MLSATQIQTGLTLHNRFTTSIPIVKNQTFHFRRQDQSILETTANGIPGFYLQLTPLQPASIFMTCRSMNQRLFSVCMRNFIFSAAHAANHTKLVLTIL